jgi:hypothetical protein
MSTEADKPATKQDLEKAITRLERFVLERETAMVWKVLLLSLTLLGAQWTAISWMMAHWKP